MIVYDIVAIVTPNYKGTQCIPGRWFIATRDIREQAEEDAATANRYEPTGNPQYIVEEHDELSPDRAPEPPFTLVI